ncbi:hypothetical protein [Paenibacillus sp. FSL K6-1318]|uniref:hypothetical protein n=1 Tax=Paenibacillus sp. FSL K6-1318 TaxID=2975291 RepID=UPI0030EEA217
MSGFILYDLLSTGKYVLLLMIGIFVRISFPFIPFAIWLFKEIMNESGIRKNLHVKKRDWFSHAE